MSQFSDIKLLEKSEQQKQQQKLLEKKSAQQQQKQQQKQQQQKQKLPVPLSFPNDFTRLVADVETLKTEQRGYIKALNAKITDLENQLKRQGNSNSMDDILEDMKTEINVVIQNDAKRNDYVKKQGEAFQTAKQQLLDIHGEITDAVTNIKSDGERVVSEFNGKLERINTSFDVQLILLYPLLSQELRNYVFEKFDAMEHQENSKQTHSNKHVSLEGEKEKVSDSVEFMDVEQSLPSQTKEEDTPKEKASEFEDEERMNNEESDEMSKTPSDDEQLDVEVKTSDREDTIRALKEKLKIPNFTFDSDSESDASASNETPTSKAPKIKHIDPKKFSLSSLNRVILKSLTSHSPSGETGNWYKYTDVTSAIKDNNLVGTTPHKLLQKVVKKYSSLSIRMFKNRKYLVLNQ